MEYYIQNKDAGFLGNAIIFWAKERLGYTCDLNNAHKFSYDEAKKICEGNPSKNKAWAVDYIDSSEGIKRIVDCQYVAAIKIEDFRDKKCCGRCDGINDVCVYDMKEGEND